MSLRGTSYVKTEDVWVARTYHNGTYYTIGRFKTEMEAHKAYLEKRKSLVPPETPLPKPSSKLTKEIRNALSTTPWRNFPV